MKNINLYEAINLMEERAQPFDIEFVSFNKAKKTGGKIIRLNNCYKTGSRVRLIENDMISVKQNHRDDHPYLINIYLITMFNGLNVVI